MPQDVTVAVYNTAEEAARAVSALQGAGIPASAIHQFDQKHAAWDPAQSRESRQPAERGFWASLFGSDEDSANDHDMYDDAVRRGGTVVSVTADQADHARIIEILERYQPIDLDDRTRLNQPFDAGAATGGVAGRAMPTDLAGARPTGTALHTGATRDAGLADDTGAVEHGERVIPLAEEQLQVGKRIVETGHTRIRRYVVETPIEERVRLRTERVVIERRRPITGDTLSPDAFQERTTDIVERAEEAVVAKTARVGEEVVVRTEAGERDETVRDTVRREEVEVVRDADQTTPATGVGAGSRDAREKSLAR